MSEGDGANGKGKDTAPPPLVRKMRSHTRHALEVAVTILSNAGGAPPSRTAGHVLFDTRDLSTGGAFLKSSSLLEIGEEIGLEFRLGSGRPVRARCKVVRVERKPPSGMGISFTKLDAHDLAALRAFMTRGS